MPCDVRWGACAPHKWPSGAAQLRSSRSRQQGHSRADNPPQLEHSRSLPLRAPNLREDRLRRAGHLPEQARKPTSSMPHRPNLHHPRVKRAWDCAARLQARACQPQIHPRAKQQPRRRLDDWQTRCCCALPPPCREVRQPRHSTKKADQSPDLRQPSYHLRTPLRGAGATAAHPPSMVRLLCSKGAGGKFRRERCPYERMAMHQPANHEAP
mmetsp:Transcript_2035/g.4441  ORF Transcript_2035/g.4441 Transcript_2035/m.4441 type:complete len:211 (-) Transcript_2035:568-1200(-)